MNAARGNDILNHKTSAVMDTVTKYNVKWKLEEQVYNSVDILAPKYTFSFRLTPA